VPPGLSTILVEAGSGLELVAWLRKLERHCLAIAVHKRLRSTGTA